ncbi:ABC transporter permease [Ferruginibacter sp.]
MEHYTFQITVYNAACFAALFVGLTFALQLWFTKNANTPANRLLALALVAMALCMVWILLIDFRPENHLPGWAQLPTQWLVGVGPFIYFFVRKTVRPENTFQQKDLLHFMPVLLQQVLVIFMKWNPVTALLAFLSVSIYLYLCYRLIEQFYRQLTFTGIDRYRYQFLWLQRLLKRFGWLWLLWVPYIMAGYFYYHQLSIQAYYPLYLFLAGMVIWLAAVVQQRTQVDMPPSNFSSPKSTIPAELKQKGAALKKTMQEGQYYLDPELNVSSLAEQLGMPSHELSRIINIALKKNFTDFINEFRIREVVRKMDDPAYDRMTLLGIAFESGFNSKTTFNRVFRQMTGKSPVEYKAYLKKERPFSNMVPSSEGQTIARPVVLHRETAVTQSPEKLNRMTMLHIYFKTAWRNILRGISFSAVNMTGLAAGLCSFIVILLYMNYELGYDKWHPGLDKVYRVSLRQDGDYLKTTPAALAGFLAQQYPNAEAATSLQSGGDNESLLTAGENKIYQKNIVSVDSNFLKVFPYKLAVGNTATALNDPQTTILTRDLGRKLFGKADPLGKTIRLNDRTDLVVTGILEDQPGATHLPVDMLIHDAFGRRAATWDNYSSQTYIRLRQPGNDTVIETSINRLYFNERLKDEGTSFENYTKSGAKTNLYIENVPQIHNFPKHGSSNYPTVTVLLLLAMLLLLAGVINFSNLSIAQSITRAKEVGIHKLMGSGRKQLILQFMLEAALQCLVSLVLAVGLLAFILPYINQFFNIHLGFLQKNQMWKTALQLAGCLLLTILLSGSYPALYLSKFNAVKVLKGDYSTGSKGKFFRNSLIVVQFMVSVFFITGIIVIKSQLSFMQAKDKGFSDEQLIRIPSRQETREQNFDNTRSALLSVPGVLSVAKTTKVPGDNSFADTATFSFTNNGQSHRMSWVKVSADYFQTLRVPLKKGRSFTGDVQDQQTRTAIINESAARELGLPDPVGQELSFRGCDSIPIRIIGVVQDFNTQGFETAVQPEVFTVGNQACMMQFSRAIVVKLESSHAQQSIAGITQAWKKIEPAFPFRYSFVDQNFEQLFISYVRLEKIITFFGSVAILISVMGLFALTAFFTRKRTKEVGIRKVLGASVLQLTLLLSRDFIRLVLLSVLIITPFSWWMAQQWLQSFAYRIAISWWMFAAAGIAALVIAMITLSFQSIRAALTNPVNSLRTE